MPLGVSETRNALKRVVTIANDPAKRFRALWYVVAWALTGVYFFIGAGYATAGAGVIQSKALNVNAQIEGGLRTHGFIMVALSILLTYGLNDYRRVTRYAMMLYFLYSAWTLIMIVAGWFINGVSWGAPWWYVLTSVLSGTLLVLAPPLGKDGKRYRGEPEGSESA